MTRRESVGVFLALVLVAVVVGWLLYVGTRTEVPEQVFPQIAEAAPTVDPRLWCEGFTNGVIFALYVDSLNTGDGYTFPTEPEYLDGIDGCMQQRIQDNPFPRGEVVNP